MNFTDFNTSNSTLQPGLEAVRRCTENCVDPAWPSKAAFFALLVTVFLAYLDVKYGGDEDVPGHVRIGLHIATLFSVANLGIILFKLGGW